VLSFQAGHFFGVGLSDSVSQQLDNFLEAFHLCPIKSRLPRVVSNALVSTIFEQKYNRIGVVLNASKDEASQALIVLLVEIAIFMKQYLKAVCVTKFTGPVNPRHPICVTNIDVLTLLENRHKNFGVPIRACPVNRGVANVDPNGEVGREDVGSCDVHGGSVLQLGLQLVDGGLEHLQLGIALVDPGVENCFSLGVHHVYHRRVRAGSRGLLGSVFVDNGLKLSIVLLDSRLQLSCVQVAGRKQFSTLGIL